MLEPVSYENREMEEFIGEMSHLFDVVRLVDPIRMIVYVIEDGKLVQQEYHCYHVWKKGMRCENCISARCYMAKERCSKFEFIDNDLYHVVAQPVIVGGRDYVLEIVTKSNDNVLISAYGQNEFVDKINEYNHRIYTDALTGIANRGYIDERYPVLVNYAYTDKRSLSTIMIDVDDFKLVNDNVGHQHGDEVLRFVADTLKKNFAVTSEDIVARYGADIVARYGGDEFFVALRNISKETLSTRIQRFQKEIAESGYGITVSAGAYYQENVTSLDFQDMIRRADEALYSSKERSKGRFMVVELV